MGTMLADYNGVDSGVRYYGTNGHRDTAWIGDGTGAVTATLRYDPWGGIIASSGTTPDWRFQGSWYDTSTDLQWVITRWYAPSLGRFVSEDTLLGTPINPLSRHLYAYAEGDPVGGWDPDGRERLGFIGRIPKYSYHPDGLSYCNSRPRMEEIDVTASGLLWSGTTCHGRLRSWRTRINGRLSGGLAELVVNARIWYEFGGGGLLSAARQFVTVYVGVEDADTHNQVFFRKYGGMERHCLGLHDESGQTCFPPNQSPRGFIDGPRRFSLTGRLIAGHRYRMTFYVTTHYFALGVAGGYTKLHLTSPQATLRFK
jgi:RHS repeat-associated protein